MLHASSSPLSQRCARRGHPIDKDGYGKIAPKWEIHVEVGRGESARDFGEYLVHHSEFVSPLGLSAS